jgi:hypothetical protein
MGFINVLGHIKTLKKVVFKLRALYVKVPKHFRSNGNKDLNRLWFTLQQGPEEGGHILF